MAYHFRGKDSPKYYKKARESFDKAIELTGEQRIKAGEMEADSIEADALSKKALTLREQKETRGSQDALEKAIERDEKTALSTLNNEALDYYDDEKYDEALKAFDEAIDLYPKNYQAWYWKGLIYHYRDCHKKAIKAFEKAIKAFEKATKASEKATKASEKATNIEKGYSQAYFLKGLSIYYETKNFEKAKEAFEKAIKYKPKHADAWNS